MYNNAFLAFAVWVLILAFTFSAYFGYVYILHIENVCICAYVDVHMCICIPTRKSQ